MPVAFAIDPSRGSDSPIDLLGKPGQVRLLWPNQTPVATARLSSTLRLRPQGSSPKSGGDRYGVAILAYMAGVPGAGDGGALVTNSNKLPWS